MADRSPPRCRSRAATAVAGLVVVACASCAVQRTESAAGPALASPAATVRPVPTSAAPTAPVTSPSTSPSTVVPTASTSSSATPTVTSVPTPTDAPSTTSEVVLRADTISFGPPTRSVHFSRPARWTQSRVTTSDGARARNRTIFRSPDGGLSLTVEIAPASTSSPLTSAFGAQAARSDRGTPGYRLVRIENGPGDGATWEFLSTVGGVARHSADWFATVGSTDLAVFVTGPARDWDAAHGIWARVVDSVEAGEEPPGYPGPTPPTVPTTTPATTPQVTPVPTTPVPTTPVPTSAPTLTVAPTDGSTVAPGPTPNPGRTIGPDKTRGPGKTKEPKGD